MHYVQLIELKTDDNTSCRVKSLMNSDVKTFEDALTAKAIVFRQVINMKYYEMDVDGVQLLNILSRDALNYRVMAQSMVIEESYIGGRTVQTQNIIYTLGKELPKDSSKAKALQ